MFLFLICDKEKKEGENLIIMVKKFFKTTLSISIMVTILTLNAFAVFASDTDSIAVRENSSDATVNGTSDVASDSTVPKSNDNSPSNEATAERSDESVTTSAQTESTSATAKVKSDDEQLIYNNIYNENPSVEQNTSGIISSMKFIATDKNGKVYSSGNAWDRSTAVTDESIVNSTVSNYGDILDVSNTKALSEVAHFENTSNGDLRLGVSIRLPKYYGNTASLSSSNTLAKALSTGGNDIKITFALTGQAGGKTMDEWGSLFSWENVREIQLSGIIKPASKVSLTVDFDLSTLTPKTNLRSEKRLTSPQKNYTGIDLRVSEKMYNVEDNIYGKYAGAYRITENGKNIYKQVPKSIQEALPNVAKEDLIYSMFKRLYTAGKQADLTLKSDDAAFDNSQFLINTERIFNAVKDLGYTVYADAQRGLWNSYAYSMTSGLQFTDGNGENVKLGEEDVYGIQLSPYYVELHKIFETEDIWLTVGQEWNEYDNLTYKKGVIPLGEKEAKELDNSEIQVQHNVDTSKVGVYDVKYLYEIDTDKYVTITAKVYVTARYDDKDIDDKSDKDKPDQKPKSDEQAKSTDDKIPNKTVKTSSSPKTGDSRIFEIAIISFLISGILLIFKVMQSKR